jgi:chromosome segregation ATPase
MEELRETHRLEHKSQQDEIDALRDSLGARNKALDEAQEKIVAAEKAAEQTRNDIGKAAEEYDKLQRVAKEEEEKRIKALSLLRALRQKLVKNEAEKEETDKEIARLKDAEKQAQDTLKNDRSRFDAEIVALRAAQEQQISKLRQNFDREIGNVKQQFEREATAKKGQFELDAITSKAERTKELAAKDARIAHLEATVKELNAARDSVFDQLQLRQAEVESSSSHQDALKTKTAELEYELAETKDRLAALQDEVDDLRRHRNDASRDEGNTRRLLAEAEARHVAKVRDLEALSKQLQKDRRETEDEMGRNLQERLKEVERLRAALAKKDVDYAESVQNSQKREKRIEEAEKARSELEKRLKSVEGALETVRDEATTAQQAEVRSLPLPCLASLY